MQIITHPSYLKYICQMNGPGAGRPQPQHLIDAAQAGLRTLSISGCFRLVLNHLALPEALLPWGPFTKTEFIFFSLSLCRCCGKLVGSFRAKAATQAQAGDRDVGTGKDSHSHSADVVESWLAPSGRKLLLRLRLVTVTSALVRTRMFQLALSPGGSTFWRRWTPLLNSK